MVGKKTSTCTEPVNMSIWSTVELMSASTSTRSQALRPRAGPRGYSSLAMDDEEIDELILSRLRQRRSEETADPTASAADLAAFFNEPNPVSRTGSERWPTRA